MIYGNLRCRPIIQVWWKFRTKIPTVKYFLTLGPSGPTPLCTNGSEKKLRHLSDNPNDNTNNNNNTNTTNDNDNTSSNDNNNLSIYTNKKTDFVSLSGYAFRNAVTHRAETW